MVFGKFKKARTKTVFYRANEMRERGEFESAFRLFLCGAKAGDKACQVNVGHCYDVGSGTRSNHTAALYWYRRAYRRGDASAAHNIGTIYRDKERPKQALFWFRRAVAMGDVDSNLDIARCVLKLAGGTQRAVLHLRAICTSDCTTDASKMAARALLRKLQK